MEITGEYRLKGTRQEVWDVLNDPEKLEKAIPGTDRLIVESPDHYRAEMSVGVGMIRGNFSGAVTVEDKLEPESYHMIVDGKGGTLMPGLIDCHCHVTMSEVNLRLRPRRIPNLNVSKQYAGHL